MLKLSLVLVCTLVISVLILQLQQQRLELSHQTNVLHNQIEAQQARLWNQQLSIAVYTAPNAIARTVSSQKLHMVPQSPLPNIKNPWNTSPEENDAE